MRQDDGEVPLVASGGKYRKTRVPEPSHRRPPDDVPAAEHPGSTPHIREGFAWHRRLHRNAENAHNGARAFGVIADFFGEETALASTNDEDDVVRW